MQSCGPHELCPQTESTLVWLCSVAFNKRLTSVLFEGSVSDIILSLPVGALGCLFHSWVGGMTGAPCPRPMHSHPKPLLTKKCGLWESNKKGWEALQQ